MVRTKAFLFIAIRISTVTAAADISFKPGSVASVITFFVATLAHDAGRVELAVLASPGYIAFLENFSTNSHS